VVFALSGTFYIESTDSQNEAGGAAFEVEFSDGVAVAFTGARPFAVFRRVGLSFSVLSGTTNLSPFSPRLSTYLTGSIRINPHFNFE